MDGAKLNKLYNRAKKSRGKRQVELTGLLMTATGVKVGTVNSISHALAMCRRVILNKICEEKGIRKGVEVSLDGRVGLLTVRDVGSEGTVYFVGRSQPANPLNLAVIKK